MQRIRKIMAADQKGLVHEALAIFCILLGDNQ